MHFKRHPHEFASGEQHKSLVECVPCVRASRPAAPDCDTDIGAFMRLRQQAGQDEGQIGKGVVVRIHKVSVQLKLI